MLRDVQPGQPLRAAEQNALIGEVNRLASVPQSPEWPALLLVELTSSVTMPDLRTASGVYVNVDPVPYATAKRCLCWKHGGSDAYKSYAADTGRELTVYFPLCVRDANGYCTGLAPAKSGDRLVVLANPQSGRWEAVCRDADWIRFELTEDLATTDDNKTAKIVTAAGGLTDWTVEVYNPLGIFEGVTGARGYARWFPDGGQFEIVQMVCP